MRRLSTAALVGVWFAAFGSGPGMAAELRLELTPASPERVVFDWASDRCDPFDTPDESLRAFRGAHDDVRAFATTEVNRAFAGPDLDHLQHECAVVYKGGHDDDPSRFDDRQWMTSFATDDGRHIVALVHNEFHGHLRRALCRNGGYTACWANTVTAAFSDDGGLTFREPPPPANLVASLPYRYRGDVGEPIGYFNPSDMVRWQGFYYATFMATPFEAQARGFCVARTATPDDPASWRVWDGSGYGTRFIDPYRSEGFDPARHVCAAVGLGSVFDIGSLLQDEKTGRFIAVSSIAHRDGKPPFGAGVYYSVSDDLLHWSPAELLANEDDLATGSEPHRYQFNFFSVIDRNSDARNFSTIAPEPSLAMFYVKLDTRNPPYARVLVQRDIALTRDPVSR